MTARIREQAQISRQRAHRTEALYHMSQRLTGQVGIHQLSAVAVQQLTAIFGGDVAVFLPDANKHLKLATGSHADFAVKEKETAVAQWVFMHQKQAGLGTSTLPSAYANYLPLIGSQGSVGVLAIRPAEAEQLQSHDQRQLLETFASQIASALEREQLAAQVQSVLVQAETERLRSSLLASVSHDLRTPLAVIAGASSSLLESEGSLSTETRRELYQTIFDDSHRLSRLVDNLLDMTRIESGSVMINRQGHVIEELIGSALHRMRKRLAGRHVMTHVPDDLPLVSLDGALIEQVLVNLLENIEKYTPADSPIEISARQAEKQLIVEVADNGPGLLPGDEERVFEKFYQGAAAAIDGRRGAGLGLAICRAIVVAHGGRMWAENRTSGGARFCFALPLDAAPID
ncbi:MAG: ATP-binding protein, partial [Candidatus Saccharimonadales bacterium]